MKKSKHNEIRKKMKINIRFLKNKQYEIIEISKKKQVKKKVFPNKKINQDLVQ